MDLLTALYLGVAAVAVATFFPGMLNMTAVSTSLRVGRRAGYRFAYGLAAVITLQAGVAMIFADYFSSHPAVLRGMKQWAIVILVVLAGYFLVKGYRLGQLNEDPNDRPYGGSPFWRGAGMATANFLTLPYFFAAGGWLISTNRLALGLWPKLFFTLGTGLGALLVFGIYVRLADWIRRNAVFITRHINYIIGGLFVVLAALQGYRMYG